MALEFEPSEIGVSVKGIQMFVLAGHVDPIIPIWSQESVKDMLVRVIKRVSPNIDKDKYGRDRFDKLVTDQWYM